MVHEHELSEIKNDVQYDLRCATFQNVGHLALLGLKWWWGIFSRSRSSCEYSGGNGA